jgi:molecular chaperone HscB
MNYFEMFGLPVGFYIDQPSLNRTYIQLQKKYHPDFHGQDSEEERTEALEQSSMVNRAYRTFKSPDLTMQYFLQIKGLIEEGEAYKLPPAFLMEVMEINEHKMDGASKEEVDEKANALQNEIFTEVKDILDNYDDSLATVEDHFRIKEYYYKKKYIDRLLAE